MLQFIVLGQIPGTHFQLTFAWFVFAILMGLIWLDLKFHRNTKTTTTDTLKGKVVRPGQV